MSILGSALKDEIENTEFELKPNRSSQHSTTRQSVSSLFTHFWLQHDMGENLNPNCLHFIKDIQGNWCRMQCGINLEANNSISLLHYFLTIFV
jgi:hypothetical protein